MSIDDTELLHQMQRGDTTALGLLYVRHAARVRAFAMGFVQNADDADDITHDVFFNLWQKREDIKDIVSFKAYLFRMTRNAIFSIYRHRCIAEAYRAKAGENASESTNNTEDHVITNDFLELINLVIRNMPPQRRLIYTMNRFDNKTYEEIATELGISRKTVEYHISQALSQLRKISRLIWIFL